MTDEIFDDSLVINDKNEVLKQRRRELKIPPISGYCDSYQFHQLMARPNQPNQYDANSQFRPMPNMVIERRNPDPECYSSSSIVQTQWELFNAIDRDVDAENIKCFFGTDAMRGISLAIDHCTQCHRGAGNFVLGSYSTVRKYQEQRRSTFLNCDPNDWCHQGTIGGAELWSVGGIQHNRFYVFYNGPSELDRCSVIQHYDGKFHLRYGDYIDSQKKIAVFDIDPASPYYCNNS